MSIRDGAVVREALIVEHAQLRIVAVNEQLPPQNSLGNACNNPKPFAEFDLELLQRSCRGALPIDTGLGLTSVIKITGEQGRDRERSQLNPPKLGMTEMGSIITRSQARVGGVALGQRMGW